MQQDNPTPLPDPERRAQSRSLRLIGRQALRRITTDERCFDCGRATVNPEGGVEVRRTSDGIAGFAGLAHCGRVWLCPVCNAKIMARRALEVGMAVSWADREQLQLIWGSLTVRHNDRSTLEDLLRIEVGAWRRVVSSKRWKSENATLTAPHAHTKGCDSECDRRIDTLDGGGSGRVGYIRAAELTIGENGWHPHYHPLIVYRGTRDEAAAFADWMVREWVYRVEQEGGDARIEGGQQLRVLAPGVGFTELSGYVTKQTFDGSAIALELLWSQNKTGRTRTGRAAKTAPHWTLLAEIALGVGSHIAEVDRWQELEEAIPGTRAITWSRGLRGFAGVGVEQDDQQIADEELGSKDDAVCFITARGWLQLRDNPEAVADLLTVLERGGWESLRAFLHALGIDYIRLGEAEAA